MCVFVHIWMCMHMCKILVFLVVAFQHRQNQSSILNSNTHGQSGVILFCYHLFLAVFLSFSFSLSVCCVHTHSHKVCVGEGIVHGSHPKLLSSSSSLQINSWRNSTLGLSSYHTHIHFFWICVVVSNMNIICWC